jgi:hypothetical protein
MPNKKKLTIPFWSYISPLATLGFIFGTSALVIAYGRGYRFTPTGEKIVNPTGTLAATSDPVGGQIIVDGKTGFIVNSIAEMIEAVDKIKDIRRRDCRDHVAAKFSIEQMVDAYERAFLKMIGEANIPTTPTSFIKRKIKKVREVLPKLTGEL